MRRVESLIPKILADFKAVAIRMQEVDEERERERLERERQAKLAAELSARRAANTQLIHELERQAGAWHRAQFLRRYVRAAKRTLGADSITLDLNGQPAARDAALSCSAADRPAHPYAGKDAVDETSSLVGKSPASFLAWAEHYIDQLDPLSATDHDSDMTPERSSYSDSDRDRLQGELRRLSGHTWDRASRVVATLTEDTDSPDSADEADEADEDDDHWNDDD